jgi:hypothetical protein
LHSPLSLCNAITYAFPSLQDARPIPPAPNHYPVPVSPEAIAVPIPRSFPFNDIAMHGEGKLLQRNGVASRIGAQGLRTGRATHGIDHPWQNPCPVGHSRRLQARGGAIDGEAPLPPGLPARARASHGASGRSAVPLDAERIVSLRDSSLPWLPQLTQIELFHRLIPVD